MKKTGKVHVKAKIVAKPTEIYHKKTANQKVKGVTFEELMKLGPVLSRLAEYDKKDNKGDEPTQKEN